MSRFFDLVSNAARNMQAYQPGPLRPAVAEHRLARLDSNENPYGPSLRAMEAMRAALTATNCYPDDDCTDLRRKLADHHNLPPDQILVTAGSTALLGLICQTMLAPGLNAVTSERSFIVYAVAVHAAGATLIEAPMQNDAFDLDAILAAINNHTRLVFLANPNNPTGTMFDAAAAEKFLAKIPGHVVVVLDEAYFEFALHFAAQRQLDYSRSLEQVRQGASVVVLRTFSKAHGLAGLRIGYGLGPAELLAYCARMRNTFSVSSVAQAAAIAALDDLSHIGRAVHNNAAQADLLITALTAMGYRAVPTSANFVYCDLADDAAPIAAQLRAEGVSVRPLGPWGAPTCMRVSIGTPDHNQIFLEAMRKVVAITRR